VKIEIQQEDLQQALALVANVVPAKTTLPILTCILVEAEGSELKLSATNLDISIVTTSDKAMVQKAGRAAVPASKFFTFVRSLPPGMVTIEEKKGKIWVVAGKASLEEPSMNVEEFPALPALAEGKELDLDAAGLAEMIRATAYAVSRDETRPALMGVLWELKDQDLTLVATDAHRLARCESKVEFESPGDRDMIVDTQGLLHFVRLAEGIEKAQVSIGDNQLSFRIGPTILHTRLLEGPFPDYRAVIPSNNDKQLTVDREALIQAIRRVSITADRITSQIRLNIAASIMELSATGTDGSHAEDQIEISYAGEQVEIGFNYSYLQDILKNINATSVQVSIRDSQSAALFESADAEEGLKLLCLLMPLRLTSD
jgi:DNA polymerase-3 subunit beta